METQSRKQSSFVASNGSPLSQTSGSQPADQNNEQAQTINNYEDFKLLKRQGASRRKKLDHMREGSSQSNDMLLSVQNQEMVFNVQKENQMIPLENEDVVAYKIKSAFRSARPGYLVLDKQLMEKAQPLIQKQTDIDLKVNNPLEIPKYNETIRYFKDKQNDWLQQSANISQQVHQYRAANQQTSKRETANNNIRKSLGEIQISSPFEPFFWKQEESMRQQQLHNQIEKAAQHTKNDSEDTKNYYQDSSEEMKDMNQQSPEKKRWNNFMTKQFDFEKLNARTKAVKIESNSKILSGISQEDDEDDDEDVSSQMSIEEIQGITMEADNEQQQSDQGFDKQKIQQDTLLPQMYTENILRLPEFLREDKLEIYICGDSRQREDTKSNELMIFNQISPAARDIVRSCNWMQDTLILAFPQQQQQLLEQQSLQIVKQEDQLIQTQQNAKPGIVEPLGNQQNESAEKQNIENQNSNNSPESPKTVSNNSKQSKRNFDVPFLKNNGNKDDEEQEVSPKESSDEEEEESGDAISRIQNNNSPLKSKQNQSNQNEITNTKMNSIQSDEHLKTNNHNNTKGFESSQFERPVRDDQNNNSVEKANFDSSIPADLVWSNKPAVSELSKKIMIEKLLSEIDSIQNSRKIKPKQSSSSPYDNSLEIKLENKLQELLEFVKYDSNGNDLFGPVNSDQFISSFPKNVQKIKGSTVGGFSKIKILYLFFQNYLPLTQLTTLSNKTNIEITDQRKIPNIITKSQVNNNLQQVRKIPGYNNTNMRTNSRSIESKQLENNKIFKQKINNQQQKQSISPKRNIPIQIKHLNKKGEQYNIGSENQMNSPVQSRNQTIFMNLKEYKNNLLGNKNNELTNQNLKIKSLDKTENQLNSQRINRRSQDLKVISSPEMFSEQKNTKRQHNNTSLNIRVTQSSNTINQITTSRSSSSSKGNNNNNSFSRSSLSSPQIFKDKTKGFTGYNKKEGDIQGKSNSKDNVTFRGYQENNALSSSLVDFRTGLANYRGQRFPKQK